MERVNSCKICNGWLHQHPELSTWLKCSSCGYSVLKCEAGHSCDYRHCQGSSRLVNTIVRTPELLDKCLKK